MTASSQPPAVRLRYQLMVILSTRTVLNTGYRMVYPFLPAIARGLGVDLEAVALVVTIRSVLGIGSPLLASIADSWGRKAAILLALGLFVVSLIVVALWPVFPVFLIGMVIAAAGKYLFDAAVNAYLGDRVDYARRGRAVATVELGWSLSFLVGMPLIGLLIARWGWSAPLPWLAGLALVGGLVLWRVLPADTVHNAARPTLLSSARTIVRHPTAVAALVVGLLITFANEVVGIVYGAWMEGSFGLQVAALGAASMVIGVAEMGGEGLVALLSDRLGKRRTLALGIGLSTAASLALPLLGREVGGALMGLFLFYLTFEFSLVGSLPLITELVPDARATMFAGYGAALTTARALGALIGPALFALGSERLGSPLLVNGGLAALLDAAAIVVLLIFVKIE